MVLNLSRYKQELERNLIRYHFDLFGSKNFHGVSFFKVPVDPRIAFTRRALKWLIRLEKFEKLPRPKEYIAESIGNLLDPEVILALRTKVYNYQKRNIKREKAKLKRKLKQQLSKKLKPFADIYLNLIEEKEKEIKPFRIHDYKKKLESKAPIRAKRNL